MSKPTIDELLETLRKLDLLWHSTMLSSDREVSRRVQAIRAILVQEAERRVERIAMDMLRKQQCEAQGDDG